MTQYIYLVILLYGIAVVEGGRYRLYLNDRYNLRQYRNGEDSFSWHWHGTLRGENVTLQVHKYEKAEIDLFVMEIVKFKKFQQSPPEGRVKGVLLSSWDALSILTLSVMYVPIQELELFEVTSRSLHGIILERGETNLCAYFHRTPSETSKKCEEMSVERVESLDLQRYMDKRISRTLYPLKLSLSNECIVKLNGKRQVSGCLRGYDQFMNLVLEETIEEVSPTERNNLGIIVVRGNSIHVLEPLERVAGV